MTLFVLISIFLLAPVVLLFDAAGHLSGSNFLALTAGVCTYSFMSLNLILAARPAIFERHLGGLDKLYWLHKWTGVLALVFVFIHETVGIEVKGRGATSGLSKLAAEAGELVYPLLLALGAISVVKRIPFINFELPYALWRWSHRLMGGIFAVAVFHQFFVKLPFNNSALISTYLTWMGLIALACFLYSQVAPLQRRRRYRVTSVTRVPSATIVRLTPEGKPLRHKPGQFALLSFGRTGLREPHPFTISSDAGDDDIEFSIKPSGDFTSRLRDTLQPGDRAWLLGGYGRFTGTNKPGRRQIWLAGGIGITPFLALADALTAADGDQIDLFYCVRTRDEAVGFERLQAVSRRVPRFRVHLHVSAEQGRLDAETLAATADPKGASFWFCGPAPLRRGLLKGLAALGKPPKSIHFERFEFR
ncbi:hypothetical protein EBB79_19670 [Parasedimentitalea marina]|uniref:FAD-binding FR-type domain-containing protein n=1 Tax=Parasedimentitalea marina TaxID=2483033 RepID=A0A3T0N776_9RHOB|nr:ferredoxin reductase family protein [Parasedimentitalea marina]AZV79878.1 hypothetical protein EBB79_19670 [Parasedimentitalea marina]